MKRDFIASSIASAVLTIAFCGTAAAMGASMASPAGHAHSLLNVKALIGQSVINQQGQNIGSLKTIMVTEPAGSARYGVVRQNGTSYKVPWKLLHETSTHQIRLDVKGTDLQADFIALQPAQMTASNQAGRHSFLNSKNPFFANSSNDMD